MMSRRRFVRSLGAGAALLAAGGCASSASTGEASSAPTPTPTPTPSEVVGRAATRVPPRSVAEVETIEHDSYAGWVRGVLLNFVGWLNGQRGFIGEVGWPGPEGPYSDADLERWDKMGRMWLREAVRQELWVAYWASGPWPETYSTVAHIGNPPTDITRPGQALIDLDPPYPQANGVNLAGWEWDPEHYPRSETFTWLARNGITLVRVPFDWEQLQRHPYEELDDAGARRMLAVSDAAEAAGCQIVWDCHNYEEVYHWSDVRPPQLMTGGEFTNLWIRLSELLQGHRGVAGYGLMNEPNENSGSDRWGWEARSADCVHAIRQRGDDTRIFVNTFGYSTLHNVQEHHPEGPWIRDPADNIFYEGHHYFDPWHGGSYRENYDHYKQHIGDELAGIPAEPFVERI